MAHDNAVSLASQPYFYSCACALGRGAGEKNEKYVWQVFVSRGRFCDTPMK